MKPIFKYFGADGKLKVTINVLVLRLPPESFGTVITDVSYSLAV